MFSLKQQVEYTDIPIIVLISRLAEKDKQLAVELGVRYYLTKPRVAELLLQLIEKTHFVAWQVVGIN